LAEFLNISADAAKAWFIGFPRIIKHRIPGITSVTSWRLFASRYSMALLAPGKALDESGAIGLPTATMTIGIELSLS
jgi:hypothetical protein